ncbi:hypothetical protein DFJ77DRAFT_455244 [Powellomyces hirtus]|nr:hypothetical protein DFJ77DRAFT_455244 [Powellomyces hirtus]
MSHSIAIVAKQQSVTTVLSSSGLARTPGAYLKILPVECHDQVKAYFRQKTFLSKWLRSWRFMFGRFEDKNLVFVPNELLTMTSEHLLLIAGKAVPPCVNLDAEYLNERLMINLSAHKNDISRLQPVTFETPEDIEKFQKHLVELNAQLRLEKLAEKYMVVLENAKQKLDDHIFLALDVEAYEADHTILLEIGWTLWSPKLPKSSRLWAKHYVITDNLRYRNGRYVPDHRYNFNQGDSVEATLEETLEELRHDFRRKNVVLIGHDIRSDIEYLEIWGLDPTDYTKDIFDTRDLFVPVGMKEQTSLKTICTDLNIPTKYLHNAGNDAYYTMLAFMAMVA